MLKLIDFLHVLILDSEVFQLRLDLPDAVLHLVLFLNVHHQLVEVLLQLNNLLIDACSDLVLLCLLEDVFLDIVIKLLDSVYDALGIALDLPDLVKDALDLGLLLLQGKDNFIDTLQILVSAEVLWKLLEFLLHILKGLSLVL